MKWIGIAIIYASFFALIGGCCYITKSAWPLMALVFTPSFSSENKKDANG